MKQRHPPVALPTLGVSVESFGTARSWSKASDLQPKAHTFLHSLVEVLLPLELCPLDSKEHRIVIADVTRFICVQLNSLPEPLRWALNIGFIGFRVVTYLRFLRGLELLPVASRRAWLERWTYGSFAFGRQLFRAVRCNALMAFYDHPLMLRPTHEPQVNPIRVNQTHVT